MEIEFDPAKDLANQRKHGLSLSAAGLVDWGSAVIRNDTRQDYLEDRFQAIAEYEGRLYFVAFTVRGHAIRVISMRKANKREEKRYEQA